MRIHSNISAILATLLVLPSLIASGLEWETTKISRKTDFDQEKVIALYPFKNVSNAPIKITNTKASCGCTVPSLEKTTYAPGESGNLTAEFDIGGRTGHQFKEITVTTDESDEGSTYSLFLEVDIPQAIKLKRRAMIWRIGSDLETQTGTVEIHPDLGISIDGFEHLNLKGDSNFAVSVTPTDSPNVYNVSVTPKEAQSRTTEYVVLTSKDDAAHLLKGYRIALYVR